LRDALAKTLFEVDVAPLPEKIGIHELAIHSDILTHQACQSLLNILRRDVSIGQGVD